MRRSLFRSVVVRGAVGALVAALAACGGGPSPAPPASPVELAPVERGDSTPTPEGSGPEPPASPQPKVAVLHLPSLPTGGTAVGDDTDQADQCAQASWRASEAPPPPGVRVTVVSVGLTPPGRFEVGGTGCAGVAPLCPGGSFAYTAENVAAGEAVCYVPMHATGKGQEQEAVTLTLEGSLVCPAGEAARCSTFADEVGHSSPAVTVYVPSRPSSSDPASGS